MGPSDTVIAGEVLVQGTSLSSPGGRFRACVREDGDLVVEDSQGPRVWSSGTRGHPSASAAMQDDGRLVVRDFYRQLLWSSLEDTGEVLGAGVGRHGATG